MRAAGDQIIVVRKRYRWKFFEQIITVAYVKSSHRKCSIKNVLLKILQISQENTCVGVSF